MPQPPMTLDRFLELAVKVCWIVLLVVVVAGLLGAITLKPL